MSDIAYLVQLHKANSIRDSVLEAALQAAVPRQRPVPTPRQRPTQQRPVPAPQQRPTPKPRLLFKRMPQAIGKFLRGWEMLIPIRIQSI